MADLSLLKKILLPYYTTSLLQLSLFSETNTRRREGQPVNPNIKLVPASSLIETLPYLEGFFTFSCYDICIVVA